MSLPGNYLDGRSHAGKAVMLQRDAHHLVFTDGVHTHRYPAHSVKFLAGASGLPDQLQLPDGGVIEVASAYGCQHLTRRQPLPARLLEWLQHGWPWLRLLLLALVAAALWGGYRNGLPWLAAEAARRTPVTVEQEMASASLKLLEKTSGLRPSQLSPARQDSLQKLLLQAVPHTSRYHYQLRLVDARELGPDIIPLPAGLVVMSDQLVKRARSDDELFAMLAHAVGHIEARHGLRGLIRTGGPSLAVSLFTGDSSTLQAVAPIMLADMKYSAEFEHEADVQARRTLAARGLSPCLSAALLARLDGPDHAAANLLSAHPGDPAASADLARQCAPAS
jgi:Zn-dependent protease with chaperone function